MTATNHVVTGAVIGAAITNPILAIPIAFLAHFALDALPHYGDDNHTSKKFLYVLIADMSLAMAVLISIAVLGLPNWPLLVACGVACASPDLMWLPRWIDEMRGKKPPAMGAIRKFHSRIQWCERSWGIGVEAIWFMCGFFVLTWLSAM